ncbi:MAG: BatA domain-containing protein, partial [Phycisphaerales bacterium]
MTFLNSTLLAVGLAAIAIPIIIHLLMRRRRTPVMWAAMRFLEEAYRRTRRRLLIERWLLLATRCLLLAALAVAIGRPILGSLASTSSGGRTVFLLIDDSLASALRSGGERSLGRHLATADRLLGDLGDADRVAIISLAGPARGVLLPPAPATTGARSLLESFTPRDSKADLPGALALVTESITALRATSELLAPTEKTHVVILSDLHEGSIDVETALPKLPPGVRLSAIEPIATGPETGNISITSNAPLRSVIVAGGAGAGQPAQAQPVTVGLARSGPGVAAAAETKLTLRLGFEGRAALSPASVSIRWAPGQREATTTLAVDG